LNNVWLDVSVQRSASLAIGTAAMYGVAGFVVDMDDPDTTHSYDFMWDSMIQKDVAEGHDILSIDTGSASSAVEFEPGELDLYQLFGDNLTGNMQMYQRREVLTYPKRPIGYDPSNDTFIAQDAFKVHIRNGPTVKQSSVGDNAVGTTMAVYDVRRSVFVRYVETFDRSASELVCRSV